MGIVLDTRGMLRARPRPPVLHHPKPEASLTSGVSIRFSTATRNVRELQDVSHDPKIRPDGLAMEWKRLLRARSIVPSQARHMLRFAGDFHIARAFSTAMAKVPSSRLSGGINGCHVKTRPTLVI